MFCITRVRLTCDGLSDKIVIHWFCDLKESERFSFFKLVPARVKFLEDKEKKLKDLGRNYLYFFFPKNSFLLLDSSGEKKITNFLIPCFSLFPKLGKI